MRRFRLIWTAVNESTKLFRVKIVGAERRSVFDFKMVCGPGEPVITILLPNED